MSNNISRYDQRGVSSDKSELHEAIKHLDKGLFPNAFCKILPDTFTGSNDHVQVLHVDTAGTKTALAYLYWKETGDLSVWKGIAQDALVMNLDDMACVGMCDQFIISSNIARNKKRISSEVLSAIISGTQELIEEFKALGVHIIHAGGETADVGDIVRTIDVGFTVMGRIPKQEVIENNIKPGAVIVGFSSFGQANYESFYNSGIGCNGLTSARHDMLSHEYALKYPETFDDTIDPTLVYSGTKKITDLYASLDRNIGQLILSPTRTYVPVIREIIGKLRPHIQGIIHCSGGGQTKVMKFVKDLHVIKDQLFKTPPLFEIIQKESSSTWKEMYQTFNMGHRLEIYTDLVSAKEMIKIAESFGVEAKLIGRCDSYQGKKLTIESQAESIEYLYD